MLLYFYLPVLVLSAAVGACPTEEEPPCSCVPIGFHASTVTCLGVNNELDLKKSLVPMRSALPIRQMEIFESRFNFIPSDAFKGLKIPTLFIAACTLSSLSDSDVAFEGLEDSLEILKVHETMLLNGWEWAQLRNLRSLREIQAVKSGPLTVDEDIRDIAHLNIEKLSLVQSELSHIDDTAFSTFHNLIVLSLKDNAISELRRSMFPRPATKLEMLLLSSNKIESIPDDLFSEMPALKTIILRGNQITTLSQEAFRPVWSNLKTFDFLETPLRCDCRISWILKEKKFPLNTRGTCAEPDSLKGKKLVDLKTANLVC
ncbi:carboxypeptidase N subunit 2-like [Uloborus diversus]|uniref:carboxypeptidase N subunit 2-like n=1 Tax=Uloborus diversus TaxID=327109 RepID=UPI0024091852|nr:carboxypeptidase N subunit 2-like [Uloborus diversus]